MELKEIVESKLHVIAQLKTYLQKEIIPSSSEELKEDINSKVDFMESGIGNLLENYTKFKQGEFPYIYSCFDNYEWPLKAFRALVKLLKPKWNSELETFRIKYINLNLQSRHILVEEHNQNLTDEQKTEQISQEDRSNKVENILADYFYWQFYQLADQKMKALDGKTLSDSELEAKFGLSGVLAAYFGDIESAIHIFSNGVEKWPQSFGIRWNLALMLEKQCQFDEAKAHLDFILKTEERIDYLLKIARLYYLWNRYEDGLNLSQKILQIYHKIKIVDEHFLMTRGYPPYKVAFANLAVFAMLTNTPSLIKEELEYAKSNLGDFPSGRLEPIIKGFLDEKWDDVITNLINEREAMQKYNGDTSYQDIVQALLQGRKETTYDGSINILNSIKQDPEYADWTFDLLLIGKMEAAVNFHQENDKNNYVNQFFEKQPLLFEPHHVFNFGLLNVQESLKEIYQTRKRKPNEGLKINYYYV